MQNYLQTLAPFTGFGTNTSTTPGNPLLGALGGWSLFSNMLR